MFLTLNIISDIKFSVLDIFRGLGVSIIKLIYSTIDVLFDVANKVNSLNMIEALKNLENSPFIKIFNAFFILAFLLLLVFSIWKVTFRVMDAEQSEQPLFETIKEIVKCGFLIFCVYFLFNTSINLGINLSSAIHNAFNTSTSTVGEKMQSAYLQMNDKCYRRQGEEDDDKKNVKDLKEQLEGITNTTGINTMEDFETVIRNGNLNVSQIVDAGAFNYRCKMEDQGFWVGDEDYAFNYNFLFGIVIGIIFLYCIAFAVIMLGKRQIEIIFLMLISPVIIGTSVGRKEQRSALYQQLTSLILQAGAMMLMIGLTTLIFDVIQNSNVINSMSYFTKTVTQSILYIGTAMMLLTGSSALNRFIGENVSANSGRDMLMAMSGLKGGLITASHVGMKLGATGKGIASGGLTSSKGISRVAQGIGEGTMGVARAGISVLPVGKRTLSTLYNARLGRQVGKAMRAEEMTQSENPKVQQKGEKMLQKAENKMQNLGKRWNYETGKASFDSAKEGLTHIKSGASQVGQGIGTAVKSVKNIGPSNSATYQKKANIKDPVKRKEGKEE